VATSDSGAKTRARLFIFVSQSTAISNLFVLFPQPYSRHVSHFVCNWSFAGLGSKICRDKFVEVEEGSMSLSLSHLACPTLMMNPRLVLHLLLLLAFSSLQTISSAFTTSSCDATRELCVKQEDGVWCFSSTRTTNDTTCRRPYSVPLRTHLEQIYSIAYYSAIGHLLGDADYFVDTDITYLCMSTWIGDEEHYTVCGQVFEDNSWNVDCAVNVAPSDVIDGCYVYATLHFLLFFLIS